MKRKTPYFPYFPNFPNSPRFISPIFLISLVLLLVLGPLAYFRFLRPKLVSAGWFNDMWAYRKAITFNNSGAAVTNQKVK